MKKGIKKLSLAKETLRHLSGESLRTVPGGGFTQFCTDSCGAATCSESCFNTCDTCNTVCASAYDTCTC